MKNGRSSETEKTNGAFASLSAPSALNKNTEASLTFQFSIGRPLPFSFELASKPRPNYSH
jgi:hypothetical protein